MPEANFRITDQYLGKDKRTLGFEVQPPLPMSKWGAVVLAIGEGIETAVLPGDIDVREKKIFEQIRADDEYRIQVRELDSNASSIELHFYPLERYVLASTNGLHLVFQTLTQKALDAHSLHPVCT